MPRFPGNIHTDQEYHALLGHRARNERRLADFIVCWVPAMKQQELRKLIATIVSNHQDITAYQATHDVAGAEIQED